MTYTHQIISMTAGKTSGSGSPMWRCKTLDGQSVNVFKHLNPERNSWALFEAAGYGLDMISLALDESLLWETSPIGVTMVKDYTGQWWNIAAVEPRPDGAIPDTPFMPDHALVKRYVQRWAEFIVGYEETPIIWDTETTGTGPDAEIVSFAAIASTGEVLFDTLIRPEKPEKLALNGSGAVNGITAEMLADAPTFSAGMHHMIQECLNERAWVIFNAEFDAPLLERTCLKYGFVPPRPAGITCAMEMFARWWGEWNAARQCYTPKGLQFAREQLGIPEDGTHTALGDARTTLRVIEALAAQKVEP